MIIDDVLGTMTANVEMNSPFPLDGYPPHIGHEWTFISADGTSTQDYIVE